MRQQAFVDVGAPPWRAGFASLEAEHAEAVALEVRGRVPAELEGTLYRIGPARMAVYGQPYGHWFDGDGMVHALRFAGGGVTYRNRFVDTRAKRDEDRARARVWPSFACRPAGGPIERFRRRKGGNRANTSVVLHGGSLLALWEGGRPHRLDPLTLATLGEDDLGGALGEHDAFSAHPKFDAATGELWNFGVAHGRVPLLHLYCRSSDGRTERRHSVAMPHASMVHDFALTARHAVFVLGALALPRLPLGLMLGQQSYADALRYDASLGTRVAVVERASGRARWYRARPRMLFHVVHAFDEPDDREGGDVTVDVCGYPDGRVMQTLREVMVGPIRTPTRAFVERLTLRAEGGVIERRLSQTPLELPRVAAPVGVEHRRVYGVAWDDRASFLNCAAAVDLPSGQATLARQTPAEFAGECVPVPKADAADSWVLTLVLDGEARRTELRVLDGADLAAPPVARVALPHAVPFGFHGSWVPAAPPK